MKTKISRYAWGPTLLLLTIILFACSPPPQAPDERESAQLTEEPKAAPGPISSTTAADSSSSQLPVRFQTPGYTVVGNEDIGDLLGTEEEFTIKVGADITSTAGPVVLRDIIKKLAALKNMNVSWSSDVDQYSYVDVDIRADDDFFKSFDNLLRQRDYFHEVQGNTIVVKFRETRQFHLAMPFVNSKYDASVGAKVSDNSSSKIDNSGNTFDIWDNVKKNLDTVLQIWETTKVTQEPTPGAPVTPKAPGYEGEAVKTGEPAKTAVEMSRSQSAKGYYTIDKPIGLITVTAPRPIMEKVESYLNNLKTELYKQISIEAKILEVTVLDEKNVGIDWGALLDSAKSSGVLVEANIGNINYHNPLGESGIRSLKLTVPNFTLLLDAIEKQGKTKVLANPRISVLNGQPALINIGKQVTYVKKVTSTTNATTGEVTYSIETEAQSSGIMMSVVPTILDNQEIILNLIPVTSTLDENMATANFGSAQVGLPVTNVRELSTVVRIKQGEMLVVGGLIDSSDSNNDAEIPLLGKLPFIGGFFGVEKKLNTRRELVILLKPEIIS